MNLFPSSLGSSDAPAGTWLYKQGLGKPGAFKTKVNGMHIILAPKPSSRGKLVWVKQLIVFVCIFCLYVDHRAVSWLHQQYVS